MSGNSTKPPQPPFRPIDLEVEHVRGSGPGGQHRNKRYTGVRVTDPKTGITVRSTERRSQHQNLVGALARLEEKIQSLHRRKKRRKKTAPPRSADKKRLERKRVQAQRKGLRSKKAWE